MQPESTSETCARTNRSIATANQCKHDKLNTKGENKRTFAKHKEEKEERSRETLGGGEEDNFSYCTRLNASSFVVGPWQHQICFRALQNECSSPRHEPKSGVVASCLNKAITVNRLDNRLVLWSHRCELPNDGCPVIVAQEPKHAAVRRTRTAFSF